MSHALATISRTQTQTWARAQMVTKESLETSLHLIFERIWHTLVKLFLSLIKLNRKPMVLGNNHVGKVNLKNFYLVML